VDVASEEGNVVLGHRWQTYCLARFLHGSSRPERPCVRLVLVFLLAMHVRVRNGNAGMARRLVEVR
jgi:hypothetical protein